MSLIMSQISCSDRDCWATWSARRFPSHSFETKIAISVQVSCSNVGGIVSGHPGDTNISGTAGVAQEPWMIDTNSSFQASSSSWFLNW
jgi:hypothetical protein